MKNQKFQKIGIIGSPIDYSSFGHQTGCNAGPAAIRQGGLLRALQKFCLDFCDYGDITVPPAGGIQNKRLKYLPEIAKANAELYTLTTRCLKEGNFPLVLGGDHSAVIGSIKAVNDFYNGKAGLLWVDSHPDCNNQTTTTSGNIHGMVVPQITDGGTEDLMKIGCSRVKFSSMAFLGVKNADQAELSFIVKNKIKKADVWDITKQGISPVVKKIIKYLSKNNKKTYVSWDLDVIDIQYAPGVGTPTYGGLTYREALYFSRILRELKQKGLLAGLDIVELNPNADENKKTTALAVELIMSVLGYEYGPFAIFRDNRRPIE